MAIELTYSDDADGVDFDRAILQALGKKKGYVVQLTTEKGEEDVVVDSSPGGWDLWCRRYGDADGPLFAIDRQDILSIKIY